jgi:gliding motility-associated-like protein
MNLIKKLLVLVLLVSTSVFGQTADFSLQVDKTDETCPGNGSLSFEAINTAPGASVLYKIYLMPDSTNPIAVQSNESLGSLAAGTYSVVAVQTAGGATTTKQANITIYDQTIEFNFNTVSANENCTGGGSIIINAASGTAVSYEIISGPQTRPLQSSNVFHNLPMGTYNVRVFDSCGLGKVKTHTLTYVTSVLSISNAIYPDVSSPQCNTITVQHRITPSEGIITYPLTVEQEFDASGDPVTNNQTFTSGPSDELLVSAVVPRGDEVYGYTMRVTNNCNVVYEKEGTVNPEIELNLSTGNAQCSSKYLIVDAAKFAAPYTLAFVSAPEGFNASQFQSTTSFSVPSVKYGNENTPVPFGEYVITITDACGRTITKELNVELELPEPVVATYNKGCFADVGTIKISIPERGLASARIISAPAAYNEPLPKDVSHRIDDESGIFAIREVPLGEYVIEVTDECGFTQTVTAIVPVFVEQNFAVKLLPSCEGGYGSIFVKSRNSGLVSMVITSAPAGFGQVLPYNVNHNITEDGEFYMSNLPEGNYVFKGVDECGIQRDMNVTILGYQYDNRDFEFVPYCGSFSIMVRDLSNMGHGATYWLQKYDPATGTWGHPVTGAPYTEGTEPTTATGKQLLNYIRVHNLTFTGKFRIIKKYGGYGNGTRINTTCFDNFGEFTFTDQLQIINAYTLACLGQPDDVYLEVTGHPIFYKIIEKNGQPFTIYNGANNIFTNLEPAEYAFMIQDACGNVVVKRYNLIDLPAFAGATTPNDMVVCNEQGVTQQSYEFHLTDQNAAVLGELHSGMYTVSYHLTQEDADTNRNPLPEYYTNTSNGQRIFVRVEHNQIDLCHGTTSFQLFIGTAPQPQITTTGAVCEGESLVLTADAGYSSYYWSTGETTRTIFVNEPGIYSVVVERAYGTAACSGYAETEITESSAPEIVKLEILDWNGEQNKVIVHVDGKGEYLYSADGINYQESNELTGLDNGVYQIYVKDAKGCGTVVQDALLLNYPRFFTPNGDGVNDTWRIKYSHNEPNMDIKIYDRLGKIVASFGANHHGWDGSFNGLKLPSTDYWFVVTREDGREMRGHFAMIR